MVHLDLIWTKKIKLKSLICPHSKNKFWKEIIYQAEYYYHKDFHIPILSCFFVYF